jgi:hypothetical protein
MWVDLGKVTVVSISKHQGGEGKTFQGKTLTWAKMQKYRLGKSTYSKGRKKNLFNKLRHPALLSGVFCLKVNMNQERSTSPLFLSIHRGGLRALRAKKATAFISLVQKSKRTFHCRVKKAILKVFLKKVVQ